MGAPSDTDTLIGTVIDGRFEIRDKLGQGGMGTVYRAWQRSVGREVAIKLIDRSISNDPMAVRRFLREAHLASQLSHPNTISVLDFGHLPDGRLFTAMELLRGRTLGRELRAHGPFSLERIAKIGEQLCDALEAAHRQRIVHRDLKLDNVMLLDHGNDLIKVLDFGLAKTLDDKSTQATAAGIVVGTPRYIAPETAMTGEATPASDMYAVGVMLGELALATPLWEGATLSVILQHQLQPAPVVAKVPPPLREVVARLLDVRPQMRPSAPETRKLLELIGEGKLPLDGAPVEQSATVEIKRSRDREPQRAPSRKYALLAGGVVVFVGSVLVAYFATHKDPRPAPRSPDVVAAADAGAVVHAAPIAGDPWTKDPTLSPIVKGDTEPVDATLADRFEMKVINIPKRFVLIVDGKQLATNRFSVERGARVALEIWNPDQTAMLMSSSFRPDSDEIIDVGVKRFDDCVKTDKLCQEVYCMDHRDDRRCQRSRDDDVPMNPFD